MGFGEGSLDGGGDSGGCEVSNDYDYNDGGDDGDDGDDGVEERNNRSSNSQSNVTVTKTNPCTVLVMFTVIGLAAGVGLLYAVVSAEGSYQYHYCDEISKKLFAGEQNFCKLHSGQGDGYATCSFNNKDKFTHYLFNEEPETLVDLRHVEYFTESYVLEANHYAYYFYILPKGSYVDFTVSSESDSTTWYWSTSYSNINSLKYNNIWKGQGMGNDTLSYEYHVTETRLYYLTCANNDRYNDVVTHWNVSLDYAMFDVSKSNASCTGKTLCNFSNAGGKYIVSSLKPGSIRLSETATNDIYFKQYIPPNKSDSYILLGWMVVFFATAIICIIVLIVRYSPCSPIQRAKVAEQKRAIELKVQQQQPPPPPTQQYSYPPQQPASYPPQQPASYPPQEPSYPAQQPTPYSAPPQNGYPAYDPYADGVPPPQPVNPAQQHSCPPQVPSYLTTSSSPYSEQESSSSAQVPSYLKT